MDIDMAVLRSLEREKDISLDVVVEAIEQALLVAYHRTEGAQPHARAELDVNGKRQSVAYADVAKAKVQIEFNRAAGNDEPETPADGTVEEN